MPFWCYYIEVDTDKPLTWGNRDISLAPMVKKIEDAADLARFIEETIEAFKIVQFAPEFVEFCRGIRFREHDLMCIVKNKNHPNRELGQVYTSLYRTRKALQMSIPDLYEACKMAAAFDHSSDNWLQFDGMSYWPKEVVGEEPT
jgi:hypothetical protein